MHTIELGRFSSVGGQPLYWSIIIGRVNGEPHVTASARFHGGATWANYNVEETMDLLRRWK